LEKTAAQIIFDIKFDIVAGGKLGSIVRLVGGNFRADFSAAEKTAAESVVAA
jgi:hypothetical protein